jgi:exonuclease III
MTIRLLTYNIMNGGHGRENLIVDIIRQSQADIVVLQEVFDDTPMPAFAQALGMDYYVAASNVKWHVALLSRFPFGGAITHREAPIWRGLLEATVATPAGPLKIFGVHLHAGLMLGNELRRYRELPPILKHTAPHIARPCVVTGDFNAVAPGDRPLVEAMPAWLRRKLRRQGRHLFRFVMRKVLRAGWVDCFRLLNPRDEGFTYATGNPDIRYDYVLTSPVMQSSARQCRVLREGAALEAASDHYPIMAEFSGT